VSQCSRNVFAAVVVSCAPCVAGSISAMPTAQTLAVEDANVPFETVQMRRGGATGGPVMGGGANMRSAPMVQGGANVRSAPMAQGGTNVRSTPMVQGGAQFNGGTFRSAQGPSTTWQGRQWRGRRWFGPGLGFGAGFAYASPYYYDDYYYDAYPYYDDGYYDQGYVVGGDSVDCRQRYRSYDPASGTYLGYDGLRHPCP
jgi:hypothetical protein